MSELKSGGHCCDTCEAYTLARLGFVFKCAVCGLRVFECCGVNEYVLKKDVGVIEQPSICFYCYHEPSMENSKKEFKFKEKEVSIVKMSGPWGEAEIDVEKCPSDVIAYGLMQLEYMQKKKNTDYIRRDIEGYKTILSSGDKNRNAKRFLNTKQSEFRAGRKFRDNLEVIEHMKRNRTWTE